MNIITGPNRFTEEPTSAKKKVENSRLDDSVGDDILNKSDLQKEKEKLKMFIKGTLKPSDNKPDVKQISHFLFLKTLGQGTFGKVKLGIHNVT